MSTMTSVGETLDRYSETTSRTVLQRFLAAAGTYWSATVDGLAAARTYHELTRRGATHEEAVEKVFDEHLSAR